MDPIEWGITIAFGLMLISNAYWTWYTIRLWHESGPEGARNRLWGVLIRLNIRSLIVAGWFIISSLVRLATGPNETLIWINLVMAFWLFAGPTQLGIELYRLRVRGKDADVAG